MTYALLKSGLLHSHQDKDFVGSAGGAFVAILHCAFTPAGRTQTRKLSLPYWKQRSQDARFRSLERQSI